MSAQTYRVKIRWTHARFGPRERATTRTATSIRRAINLAITDLLQTERDARGKPLALDAHKSISIDAWRTSGKRPGRPPYLRLQLKKGKRR